MAKFCRFDLSDYIFGMTIFMRLHFYVAKQKFTYQGLKLQKIFIFIISGLPHLE